MEEKIIALLTAQFSGVRNDGLMQLARILALQCATDEEAKALVEKLTKAQVDGFVKEFRKEVDKEVSESNRTFEANLKKKFDLVERKKEQEKPENKPDEKQKDDVMALLLAELKSMRTDIEGIKTGEVAKSRLQSLNEKLGACKSEEFKAKVLKDFGRMKFETDEEFAEYLADTEKDVTKANQGVADTSLGGQQRPWKSDVPNGTKPATDGEIARVMDKMPI